MLFSSNIFLFLFLPTVLLCYFMAGTVQRNYFLLIASLLFYAWGEPKFVLMMLLSIVGNYFGGLLIGRFTQVKAKRAVLTTTLIFNIAILGIFKYLNFITANLVRLFGDSVPVTNIALPIGISFFTFQAISYVIDVYRGDVLPQKNICHLGLYISFFPQLIAGPIVRYTTVAQQIEHRTVTFAGFSGGMQRFIRGLSKKIILSNAFAVIADQAFAMTGTPSLSVLFAWMGAISYTFQIFFDFSGYSDMAIGLGKMFGFDFLENFNYPYISRSVSEFWRRWHISLGSWFRDYVYISLGGSRVGGNGRLICNLFIVWFLTGLWHGASWHFVAWGLMYFVLLTFEKLTGFPARQLKLASGSKGRHSVILGLYRVFTLLCVVVGWVLFRANGLINALRYLSVMFGLSGNMLTDAYVYRFGSENLVFFVAAVLCSTPIFRLVRQRVDRLAPKARSICNGLNAAWYLLLFYISVSYLVLGGHNPFIYFNF